MGEDSRAVVWLAGRPIQIGHRLSAHPSPLAFMPFVGQADLKCSRDAAIVSKSGQHPGVLRRIVDRDEVATQLDGLRFSDGRIVGFEQVVIMSIGRVEHGAGEHLGAKPLTECAEANRQQDASESEVWTE